MKCPKCGYLGFETTDRCRNCQYDFSLAPFLPEQELPLHGADRKNESPHDFELPPIARQGEAQSTPLDLDRLFGESAPSSSASPPTLVDRQPAPPAMKAKAEEPAADPPIMMALDGESRETEEFAAPSDAFTLDEGALPFDDAPIMAPPAARTPLAVRRSTPEVARNRARGTRPNRPEPLDFELTLPKSDIASRAAIETVASLMEAPSLGARVGAGLIDLLLLVGIDAAILYLTLRITGLQATLDDVRVLPVIPFVGFLVVLGYGYLAAFTVAGGQTIGKMILSLRVIGDDGRPVDTAGGMLRALACLLIPITLGLLVLAGDIYERSSRASRSTRRHARGPGMKQFAVLVASFGYVGFFPFAPGTAGSLAGLALFAFIRWIGVPAIELGAIVAVFAIGIWAASGTEVALGRKDPGVVVIDEVLGMLITLALLPVSIPGVVLGFLLFRLLDVVKPYPAAQLEHLHGGLGIMADDAVAGLYSHLLLRLCVWLVPAWLTA